MDRCIVSKWRKEKVEEKKKTFFPRGSKRCHLLSTVIEPTVWHRYPHPSLHVINPWYNYFLLKFARCRSEVFRRHDHALKWRITNNLFKRKRFSKILFTDTSRWLENLDWKNWSFQDILGENYHVRSYNCIELNANLYDPSSQFD